MIKRLSFYVLLVFVLIFGAFEDVNAQAGKDKSGVYTLGEVVVKAPRAGIESIGTVREITDVEIKNQGARNLAEALALLPGMYIRVGAQGVPRVDVRGLRGRHIILLLNGIPFNSSYDGQFDPSTIGVENIAKIKMSYGNHSVLYGDGGLGGIINIVTKKGEKGVHGMLGAEAGEKRSYLEKFSVSGGKDQVDFFVSGSAYEADGFLLSGEFTPTSEEGGTVRENSDKKMRNLFGNLGYVPSDNLEIGLVLNTVSGEYGIPPSIINDKSNVFVSTPKYERMEDFEGYWGQVSARLRVSDVLAFKSWAYVNYLDEEKNAYDDSSYNSMTNAKVKTYQDDSTTTIQGVNVQSTYDMKTAGSATLGLSARQDKWQSSGMIRDVKLSGGNFAFRNYDYERKNDIYMAALEYTIAPFDKAGLVLGYSYNWFNKDDGGNDAESSYLAGMHYDILKDTRIRGSYARKIRFPSVSQLYDIGSGNADLSPEKSDNYEVGLIQGLPFKTTLEATAFYLNVQDYIEKDNNDISQNNQEYIFKGIEVTAETRFFERLVLRLGYTIMDSEDKSEGTAVTDLQYRPKHKLTFEGMYHTDIGLSAYLNVMHLSGQFCYAKKAPVVKEPFNDYTVVNAKLNQSILKDRLNIYVGVDNILDEDYEESYGFPQKGRSVHGGFELTF